jgi:hypothetical protein
MEARKLDYETQATIIPFKKEIDLTFVNIANRTREKELLAREIEREEELIAREKIAREYSAGCKRNSIIDKEDVMCFLSGLSVVAFLMSMYFLGIIL